MLFDACKKSDDGNCGYQSSNSQGLLKESFSKESGKYPKEMFVIESVLNMLVTNLEFSVDWVIEWPCEYFHVIFPKFFEDFRKCYM